MTPFEIVVRIQRAGFEAFYVGGYVRDMLLKKESVDIDITTNAKYDQLKELFMIKKLMRLENHFRFLL